MNHPSTFRRLLGNAAAIIAVWTAFGVFNASQMYRLAVDSDYSTNQSWAVLMWFQVTAGLFWSVLTPVIIFVAERLPLLKPFRRQNALLLLAIIPLFAAFRAAIGGAVLSICEGLPLPEVADFVTHSIRARLFRNTFLVSVIVGIVNLVLASRAAAAREERALKLKKEIANDELQRLRAAMQPRFFLAALHAVKSRVAQQPLVADQMIVNLGGVLRRMLDFEKQDTVSLGEELSMFDQCLELERARTAGLFTTRFDFDERLLGARVPPLLLHAVAESAVMVNCSEPAQLDVEAWDDGGMLRIAVRNNDPHRSPGTVALDATRARLQRAFGDRASVANRRHTGAVVTSLTLPLILDSASKSRAARCAR